ncbi:hypothetical protein GUITHDRAFT_108500 [Guillardia theta CCMP2712]|uniref:Uncharacterized protein n=1 Tax=Guillardia theta (strain CCMP2712) TaxID=905079 RepID=L1JBX6_GUITC|nr:hypothetical protein GUITHDRAFT_108500 [Guillardia theta CCMP2712]EKX45624.1 hypothetical protein GUITHDRAFT_108500 [Guillardia theta CCMP2712]|eukprot:XP_005832604.1 hypothetical protein GUITHDRAFT_108500 [Guillardia theta CCMP2712]
MSLRLTDTQREALREAADSFIQGLEDVEDRLWDLEAAQVASVLGQVLGKLGEVLGSFKEKLPQSSEQRRNFAKQYIESCVQLRNDSSAEPLEDDMLQSSLLAEMRGIRQRMRNRMAEEWTEETQRSAEEDFVRQMMVLETIIEELKETITSIDEEDLVQMAQFGISFARYVTTTARKTLERTAEMALDQNGGNIQISDRFEMIEEEGDRQRSSQGRSAMASTAETEQAEDRDQSSRKHKRRRKSRARRCGRIRLIWPPVRAQVVQSFVPMYQRALVPESHDPLSFAVMWLALMCFIPLLLLAVLSVPLLVMDEILQALYNKLSGQLSIIAEGEEVMFALWNVGNAWYMLGKITVKQSYRLFKRQWDRARKSPNGTAEFIKSCFELVARKASEAAITIIRDPLAPVRLTRGFAETLWSQVQSYRSSFH